MERLQKELTRVHKVEVKESHAKLERRTLDLTASQDKYLEATRCEERIRGTFDVFGDVLNKARLYDEEKGAVSAAKIIQILVDFSGRVENSLKDIQTFVSNIPKLA